MHYLMIHDIRREYFELDLSQYRLTFDDGLFSQYYYYPLYHDHPEKLTYFIATSFIRPGSARSMFSGEYIPYLKSKKYMYRSFIEQRFDHFMTTEEIQELAAKATVRIGVHSHWHDVILTRRHPNDLGSGEKIIRRATVKGKRYFRLGIAQPDREAAKALCRRLRPGQRYCGVFSR